MIPVKGHNNTDFAKNMPTCPRDFMSIPLSRATSESMSCGFYEQK